MKIPAAQSTRLTQQLKHMERIRAPWWPLWREVSDYFLPRRYPWLLTDKEWKSASIRNNKLLDSTSVLALRTLASGMMNGVTSPARPWFRLRIAGTEEEETPHDAKVWLDEVAKIMMLLMAESNFYNALAVLYLEWGCFGTASMGIYPDFDNVFRCYNYALGEFYIDVDYRGVVNRHGREFMRTVEQTVQEFGLENCSKQVQSDYTAGGARRNNPVRIAHLIEPNEQMEGLKARKDAKFREIYWQVGGQPGEVLAVRPLDEFPTISPRWEIYGGDVYGTSPCMDALADAIQLQHMTRRAAQGLDKMVSPPMLVNKNLAQKPKAMHPDTMTFVNGSDLGQGAAPVYQINIPFRELESQRSEIQQRIMRVLHNDLFRMITELDTVRSATEIDARREEKLVLLGPVLERFESEALSPCIERIFAICERSGVLPLAPDSLREVELKIQYVSVLSDAQRAVSTAPIERFLQVLGNTAQLFPDGLDTVDPMEILRDYAEGIGLKAKLLRSREQVSAIQEGKKQQQAAQTAMEMGGALAQGAQTLSQTDLGGGTNALQGLLG
jgi:hypothetical protein